MEYDFREIEKKWQQRWVENKTYKVVEDAEKKKFYVTFHYMQNQVKRLLLLVQQVLEKQQLQTF